MLKINKSTNLNALIKIKGESVLHLSASINEKGNVNFSKVIQNEKLYKENMEEVDNQVLQFQDEVRKVELDIRGGNLNE